MIQLLRNGLVLLALLFSVSTFALTLQQAKNEGLVGEQADGYLGIVGKETADVRTLVDDINRKRRAAYQNIATRNNTDLHAVEQVAGQKAIGMTASGQYVKPHSGAWRQVP